MPPQRPYFYSRDILAVNLTQAIKQQAQELGFSLVGITIPDPIPHAATFEQWLAQGRQGEMSYLDSPRSRECRRDPGLILPECHSVIVLGMRYPAALSTPGDEKPLHGRIASYAWGEDYHAVIPGRLRKLVAFIEGQVGHIIPNRGYTDTGPLLERELAQRAGLGWIGKNTCLINPHAGSYFLLAEVLLGIELEPDPPFAADRCGTCTRCIRACPTGCILPDRTIDARRCISYLTIELKGTIPHELRPLMDSWVFGCDICQQACPWNHFASPQGEPALGQGSIDPKPNLVEELTLAASDFKRKYSHTPLMRAKRRGYLRNVAVALGNSHSQEVVPALVKALQHDPEPLVRGHAVAALGQIGGEVARDALERAVSGEAEQAVLDEIRAAME